MLITIPDLLDEQMLSDVRGLLDGAEFIDGKLSAGRDAQRVKNNEELKSDAAQAKRLNQLVSASDLSGRCHAFEIILGFFCALYIRAILWAACG
jgi:predicted 2-oxoglutarate/Fe(II)-dependent dioxygenase YbiX